MILTIDTSAAVKWIVDEPGSLQATSYLPKWSGSTLHFDHVFLAPSLIALEVHNTIAKKHKRGEATYTQLAEAQFALQYVGALEPIDEDLIHNARRMSFVAKHWAANQDGRPRPELSAVFNIYDCIYIAHAQRHKSTLLTADKEQARMAQAFDVPVEFIPAV